MTGPDGTSSGGWFRFLAVEPQKRIEVVDGFGDDPDAPVEGMPTMHRVFTFASTATGSRHTTVTTFPSIEAMEQLVQMGLMDGMKSAMGQIDAVLADLTVFAASRATDAQLLSDTQVRISRVIRGSAKDIWRAHHEPALMKRWLTGPDGWTMPVCDVAKNVGERNRYEWEAADGTQRFGFEGELLESDPPYRAVTTEQMIGNDGPATRNEMTLTPLHEGTLMSLLITYPSKELRDMILGTGMTTGMESSYQRLERELLAA